MNPNLVIFFKRAFVVTLIGCVVAALIYFINTSTSINLEDIGSWLMYGLMGVLMSGMTVFIIGLVLRTTWTGIMNRVDSIVFCCPDRTQNGIHIVAYHYNPGGESTSGFNSYFHYYVDLKGKLYLSKKVEDEGSDIVNSLKHLTEQTRLPLEPNREKSLRIGSTTSDDKGVEVTMPLPSGKIRFRGYDGLIDYGFKMTYVVNDRNVWTRSI